MKDAILHLKDGCKFLNNRATYGGAIAALVESEIDVQGTVLFKNNVAADPTTPDENLAMANPQKAAITEFEDDSKVIHKGKGGAILLSLSTLKTVDGSADVTFESNIAMLQGSAIDIENKAVQLISTDMSYSNEGKDLKRGLIVYSTQENTCTVINGGTNGGCTAANANADICALADGSTCTVRSFLFSYLSSFFLKLITK